MAGSVIVVGGSVTVPLPPRASPDEAGLGLWEWDGPGGAGGISHKEGSRMLSRSTQDLSSGLYPSQSTMYCRQPPRIYDFPDLVYGVVGVDLGHRRRYF